MKKRATAPNGMVCAGACAVLAFGASGAPRGSGVPVALAREEPQPVIDMHLHAYPADIFGPPPQRICAPIERFPSVDARKPLRFDVEGEALPREEFHDYLRRLVRAGMAERVMFGSDQMLWPEAIEVGIEHIRSAELLTPQQKHGILYGNAARFLRLDESQIRRHRALAAEGG